MKPAAVDVLALTEDKHEGTVHALHRLVRKLLLRLEPDIFDRVCIVPSEPEAQAACRANAWTARADRRKLVTAARQVVTQLSTPNGLVCWHFDADVPWSGEPGGDALRAFEDRMRPAIRGDVDAAQRKPLRSGAAGPSTEDALSRLFLLIPHPALEAWLYAALEKLQALADDHGCGQAARALITTWKRDGDDAPGERRDVLDSALEARREVKDPRCVRDQGNKDLAGALDIERLHRLSPSFRASAKPIRDPAALRALLAG